jgi:hypothetical protein
VAVAWQERLLDLLEEHPELAGEVQNQAFGMCPVRADALM